LIKPDLTISKIITKEDRMKTHILKTVVRASIVIALTLLAGCAYTPFEERYRPGARDVSLWQSETIPLEPQWRYIGVEQVTVRGKIWDTSLVPMDQMQTMIFVQEGEKGPSILLLSRVVKTGYDGIFKFLGGTKTTLGDQSYRESLYALSPDTTDPEYRRYMDAVRNAGLTLAPDYRVRVLDRLPLDTVLVRVMELTPGEGSHALPSFGKLYPQERQELLRKRSR